MRVNLEPHQQKAIEAAIRAGRFRSLEEFIESAVRTLAPGEQSPANASTDGAITQSAMSQVNGLWVHRGRPESDARWDRVLEDVREERLIDLLRASHP